VRLKLKGVLCVFLFPDFPVVGFCEPTREGIHPASSIVTSLMAILLMENSVQSWHRCLVFFHHLINLVARASTSGGIVRPICLAVLRLITSSNFVGCSTGKSAGLVPFRILST
jgi:hypothetical protein